MYDIKENYKEVVRDISRPKYHFASPAKLLIDVWGGIFYKGYYHLFYDIKSVSYTHLDVYKRQDQKSIRPFFLRVIKNT